MIPDIAVIISTYAVARLLNEYVLNGDTMQQVRGIVSLIAIVIVVVFLLSVVSTAGSISDLNI
jgi:hypothetical protein